MPSWPLAAIYGTAVIILLSSVLLVVTLQRYDDAYASAEAAAEAATLVQNALAHVSDAETAGRGFVITGDDRFLERWRRARAELSDLRARLDAQQGLGVSSALLADLIERRLALSARAIDLRRTQGRGAADTLVASGRGLIVMDSLRGAVARVAGEQSVLAGNRRAAALEYSRRATAIVIAGALLAIVAAVALSALLRRHNATIERASDELRSANDELREQTMELELQTIELEESAESLQASEERYRRVVENAADMIYRYRLLPEPAFDYVNPASLLLTGHAPEEFYEDPFLLVKSAHPEDRERLASALSGDVADGSVVVVRLLRGSATVWSEHRITTLREADELVAIEAITRDVTERHAHEQELQQREQRFRELLENSSDVILQIDLSNTVTFAGSNTLQMLGHPAAVVIGASVFEHVHPDDRAQARSSLTRSRSTRGQTVQWEMRMTGSAEPWRTVQCLARSVSDPAHGEVTTILNIRDLTETRRIEDQLRQSQKMEAVGRMAGGIAHDFNNLLTAVKGHVQFALQSVPPEHPAYADIAEIEVGAERAAALTRQLLAFSRKQPMREEVVNTGELLDGLDRMLRRVVGEDVKMLTAIAPDLWSVKADRAHLEQVMLNLVVNARDAMPDGGTLRITASNTVVATDDARIQSGVAEGEFVVLTVADTGIGMDTETRRRIFEPFFTTKPPGQGTGLGLATVYGIVNQLGGHISVASSPNAGTTFRVLIPRASESRQPSRVAETTAATHQGEGVILLAEDDDAVRGLTTRMLRAAGYTVLPAETPLVALRIAEERPQGINLLLTDMVMPGMSGRELAERVLARIGNIPVIYMSGYTEEEIASRGIDSTVSHFIEKPFSRAALERTVGVALESASG